MRLKRGDRLLIRTPNWVGDVVMAEPAISALAEHVGPRNVTLAGPLALVEMLGRNLPGVAMEPAQPRRSWSDHDAAVLFTNSFRSAWGAFRAGIPVRAGWVRDGRGPLLTHGARPPREVGRTPFLLGRSGRWPRVLPRPFGAACNELASWLGAPVRRTVPRLRVGRRERQQVERRLEGQGGSLGDYVLVNVGSRAGSSKGYPAASWARVVNRLLAANRTVVLAVGPGEEGIVAAMSTLLNPGAYTLVDPVADLSELCAWIAGAQLMITADSGPRHLAVAFDCPVLVVAGPTDPRHTADHLAHTELVRFPVPCGPCHLERCPIEGAGHHACMTQVAPDALARRALDLLELGSTARGIG